MLRSLGEYIFSVVLTATALGLISYLSYPSQNARLVRCAASVLLVYVIISPLANFSGISDGLSDLIESTQPPSFKIEESELSVSAAEAFAEGVRGLVSEKYGISEENISVHVINLNIKQMRAEKIKITLSGKAALADWRSVEAYVSGEGLGDCEVNVVLGK